MFDRIALRQEGYMVYSKDLDISKKMKQHDQYFLERHKGVIVARHYMGLDDESELHIWYLLVYICEQHVSREWLDARAQAVRDLYMFTRRNPTIYLAKSTD